MERVRYDDDSGVAWLTLDDGKVNALSTPMQADIHAGLDRAQSGAATLVITGRPGIFSAGFDLGTLQAGGAETRTMVRGGFELAARLLSFPLPVVVASTGHAIAMGAFLLLSSDYRIGAAGPYRVVANEVAIGLTMPHAATELLRHRLQPATCDRVAALAEVFSPDEALRAGMLDRVVDGDVLARSASEFAAGLAGLDRRAHAATKLRVRRHLLEALHAALERDEHEFAALR